jgi:predicted  nucleic acid-binding Zn ribbon protein
MTITQLAYEQSLSDIKCNFKSCENQAIFIEEISKLETPLTKKVQLDGFMILCKEHHKLLFPKERKPVTVSFIDKEGNLICTRCGKHWKNPLYNNAIPKTCRLCTNIRWNKPYIKEKIVVGLRGRV